MSIFHVSNAVQRWKSSVKSIDGVCVRPMGDMYGVFVRGELRSIRHNIVDAEKDSELWRDNIRGR